MVETMHTDDHEGHANPATVLRALLEVAGDSLEEHTWVDDSGLEWALEHESQEDGDRWTLTVLDEDATLVCQATHVI